MPYSLHRAEDISLGLKRIAGEQLDRAVTALRDPDVADDVAIHEARKCLKKVRAILRLVIDEIDRVTFRGDNAAFRQIANDLSSSRDAAVVLDVFDRFCAPQLSATDAVRLRTLLAETSDHASMHESALREEAAHRIERETWRIEAWQIDRRDVRALRRGLKRAFKRVRASYAAVLVEPVDENLHRWRKDAKIVWYHSRLLRPREAGHNDRRLVELSQLSELLGFDRDVSMVQALLRQRAPDDDVAASRVIVHADEIRGELQGHAKTLGARLFEQRPRDYVARLLEPFVNAGAVGDEGRAAEHLTG